MLNSARDYGVDEAGALSSRTAFKLGRATCIQRFMEILGHMPLRKSSIGNAPFELHEPRHIYHESLQYMYA